MPKKLYPLIVGIFFFITASVHSQSFYNWKRDRKAVISIGAGLSSYHGDLESRQLDIDAKPNILISFMYPLVNRIDVGLDLMWYRIQSADRSAENIVADNYPSQRNLSFRSDNIELSAIVNISLFGQRNMLYYNRPIYNPYLIFGIGATYYNPKTKYEGEWYTLREYKTEGVDYGKFALVIPMGMGVNFKINNVISIGLEAAYRFTTTDYLDDVSTNHLDPSTLSGIRLALSDRRPEIGLDRVEGGHQRGNPAKNDGYFITNIKLSYYLPSAVLFKRSGIRRGKYR